MPTWFHVALCACISLVCVLQIAILERKLLLTAHFQQQRSFHTIGTVAILPTPTAVPAFTPEASVKLRPAAPAAESSVSLVPTVSPFLHTRYPVDQIPDWGAMTSPDAWERAFDQLLPGDFVPVPDYNLHRLTVPLDRLLGERTPDNTQLLTEKLFYSTRFFGAYNLDAPEFSGIHPGVDLKLALGTPIHPIAEGTVHAVERGLSLGRYVILEHTLPEGDVVYSIYGHLQDVFVSKGQSVSTSEYVGTVGITGRTTAPHLHLQIDRKYSNEAVHVPYWPTSMPHQRDAALFTLHPIEFIEMYLGN